MNSNQNKKSSVSKRFEIKVTFFCKTIKIKITPAVTVKVKQTGKSHAYTMSSNFATTTITSILSLAHYY